MIGRLGSILSALAILIAGCGYLPLGGSGGASVVYPDGCASLGFSERRCTAIVEWAAGQLGIDPDRATRIEVALPPSGENRSIPVWFVRFIEADGRTREQVIGCGVGSATRLACSDPPVIEAGGFGGYWDVPCYPDPAAGPADPSAAVCATPVPSPDPDALAAARPLTVDGREIAVPSTGTTRSISERWSWRTGSCARRRSSSSNRRPIGSSRSRTGLTRPVADRPDAA